MIRTSSSILSSGESRNAPNLSRNVESGALGFRFCIVRSCPGRIVTYDNAFTTSRRTECAHERAKSTDGVILMNASHEDMPDRMVGKSARAWKYRSSGPRIIIEENLLLPTVIASARGDSHRHAMLREKARHERRQDRPLRSRVFSSQHSCASRKMNLIFRLICPVAMLCAGAARRGTAAARPRRAGERRGPRDGIPDSFPPPVGPDARVGTHSGATVRAGFTRVLQTLIFRDVRKRT